jgi:hypothetical protein
MKCRLQELNVPVAILLPVCYLIIVNNKYTYVLKGVPYEDSDYGNNKPYLQSSFRAS